MNHSNIHCMARPLDNSFLAPEDHSDRRPFNSERLLRPSRVPVPILWSCTHPPDWLGSALPPPQHGMFSTQLSSGQEKEGVCLFTRSMWVYLYPQIQVQNRRFPPELGKEGEWKGGCPPAHTKPHKHTALPPAPQTQPPHKL